MVDLDLEPNTFFFGTLVNKDVINSLSLTSPPHLNSTGKMRECFKCKLGIKFKSKDRHLVQY